jgi:uncharacterized membrane protein
MLRWLAALVLCCALGIGCASRSSWTPTVDTYGDNRAQYLTQDMEDCRALAQRAAGGAVEQTAKGAAIGGAIGAAAGAVIGAIVGAPGQGAAIGATLGGVGGGTRRAADSDADFRRAYSNCLRERGHRVVN